MIDRIFAFSHTHCLAICGFLVPANLLATLQTMIFTPWPRFRSRVPILVTIASLYALAMVFHVFTWFAVGVVMAPTFILLFLACVCLTINGWAIAHPASLSQLLLQLWHWLKLLGNHLAITFPLRSVQSSVNPD
ncbi:hypothetical protein [Planktothricoides sp. SR001]|uniref:hypothetical protein n=1 Tax=Planktothricoides sp. SR001 TaxID=1705388 RepID=UPI00092F4C04|nr:hypothetical protein [Planktothricoides sp. SR001]